jgi:AsmA protein
LSYDRAQLRGNDVRPVKILALAVGGMIVLVIVGLVAIWLVVNPNNYKGLIANMVKESTGRELLLKGDIKLSVFPWIALQLGPASLGNPPGFDEEPFLAFDRASLRVQLLPLLDKHLESDRIEIDGLDLRLRKNAQGTGNWENFGQTHKPAATPSANASGSLENLAGIRITHSRVSYAGAVVENIMLETGAFRAHSLTPVRLSFDANRGVPRENVALNAKFDLSADPDTKDLKLAALTVSGEVSQPGIDRPAHWEITAPTIEANGTAQTLGVPSFTMSYSSAHVSGKLQATKIIDALSATGSVTLAPLVLHEFAPRLGMVLPKTTDPRALAELSASSDFSYDANGIKLEQLQAQLDDTHVKGNLAVAGAEHAIKFEFTVDQINVDRYLNPDKSPPPATAVTAKPAEAPKAEPKLPTLDGTLTVGSLHLSPLDFANVRLTLSSKDNVVHLFPSLAQIDGGSYSGDITLDGRGTAPAISLDEHLSGVDMARLAATTAYQGRISGRGNVNVKATARGAALDAVMQTLNGHFDMNLADGALEGVDLGYELGRAQALLRQEAGPARSDPPRTKFDAFKMSAEIVNGLATTKDLTIASPVLRITGQGNANLVNKGINISMLASLMKSPGTSAADIPLKITGTYVDPTIRPDVEALAKGQVRQKLQDLLRKNGLEGLFGK